LEGFELLSSLVVVLMSTLIASSKLSGWSETGLAVGMTPALAALVAHSWKHTSSENAAPVAFSRLKG
jgi:hypothetical protein